MSVHHRLFTVFALLTITGCAGTDRLVQRQTALEGRLEQLAQSQQALTGRLGELSNELRDLQERQRKLAGTLADNQPAAAELQGTVTRLSQRVDKIEADLPPLQATRIEVVNRETPGDEPDGKAQAAYMKAFGLFSANDFTGAAQAFTVFLRSHPKSEYAGNAQYWLGECHYSAGGYAHAVESFNRVLTEYPHGKKVPDAMLKIGFSWFNLGNPAKGREMLKSLVEKYPESEAAGKARKKLERK
jgi:tol-pal system protein YbgF